MLDAVTRREAERILDTNRPLVVYLARRLYGDPEDAADLVQEASIKLWGVLDSGRLSVTTPPKVVGAYIAQIVLNEWRRMQARRARKVQSIGFDDLDPLGFDFEPIQMRAPVEQTPEVMTEAWEFDRLLRKSLRLLPPAQRRAFVAHEVEGLSYAEASRQRGISHQAIHAYCRQAKTTLGQLLREYAQP